MTRPLASFDIALIAGFAVLIGAAALSLIAPRIKHFIARHRARLSRKPR